eukprot:TRINITY_DN21529_c0_g1_i1.p1 TRINITY_DN21529_c0_g1~~TRINITY_DN21529_c0_g1_i1.p1  ORF type:complete len:421 (-),score=60.00 TRINITY_DN21529_c0_g1_i1:135-1397(-)
MFTCLLLRYVPLLGALSLLANFSLLAEASKNEGTKSSKKASRRYAFVTLATDDYFAKGAFVTLHSVNLHVQPPDGKPPDVDLVLMVPVSDNFDGPSKKWIKRFKQIGARVVKVPQVEPSYAMLKAMKADRGRMENMQDIFQPVPYGAAFSKIHAWDPKHFGDYEKVVLLDGDILAINDIRGLLKFKPLSAAKDQVDAFNYGVVVLKPDAKIHSELNQLLQGATEGAIGMYSNRSETELGMCDQTLVAGYLATHHGPINFFDDRRQKYRDDPKHWLLSTEYNVLVPFATARRCENKKNRKAMVDQARLLHFGNNWLYFDALVKDRNAFGRINAPWCYLTAFHYWHDVYHHGVAVADSALSKDGQKEVKLPEYKEMAKSYVEDTDGDGMKDKTAVMFHLFKDNVGSRIKKVHKDAGWIDDEL